MPYETHVCSESVHRTLGHTINSHLSLQSDQLEWYYNNAQMSISTLVVNLVTNGIYTGLTCTFAEGRVLTALRLSFLLLTFSLRWACCFMTCNF